MSRIVVFSACMMALGCRQAPQPAGVGGSDGGATAGSGSTGQGSTTTALEWTSTTTVTPLLPEVIYRFPESGTTNLAARAQVVMQVSGAEPAAVDALVRWFRETGRFDVGSGARIGLEVWGSADAADPGYSGALYLWPLTELKPDCWYTLALDEGSGFKLNNASLGAWLPVRARLFTGSALHLLRLERMRGTPTKGVTGVNFLLSEQLDVATVVASRFELRGPNGPLEGCVTWGGSRCVSAADSVLSGGAFTFRFAKPIKEEEFPSLLEFELRGSIRGAVRTLAEGAVAAHLPHETDASGVVVRMTARSQEWVSAATSEGLIWRAPFADGTPDATP